MRSLERYFPDLADAIRTQRLVDAELDEICADYELLVTDLCDVTASLDERVRREQAAIRESVDALAQEIRAKFAAGPDTRASKPPTFFSPDSLKGTP